MTLLFLQTCDPHVYRPMLDITSATVREYCARHRFGYSRYIGIIRGDKPWHAALNRIVLLRAIAASGFAGWVIYLDADAYIHDLAFDIGPILARNANVALLAAGSGVMPQQWWDINDGIFAIDLAHPGGRAIVAGWNDRLDCMTDAMLASEKTWGDVANDQEMLHCVLLDSGREHQVRVLDQTLGLELNGSPFLLSSEAKGAAQPAFELQMVCSYHE